MADFKVQRGQATIPASTLSVTISAGTDYTAPASLTAAFIRVVGASYVGDATPYSQYAPELRETANIVDPTTLLTSVTFQRYDTTNTGALTIEWEIIEYVGAAGGANEMIVRHVEALNPAGGVDVIDTATVSGVVTDADVAVFVTSAAVDASDRLGLTEAEFTAAWVPASQYAELTRIGDNNHSSYVSVAVVEFTGSNWSVQRVEHTYAAVGVVETEPITAVPSLSQAFIHPQMRAAYGGGSSSMAQTAWLSAADTVSFELDSTASTYSQVGVVWIISNTATGTGAMNVQRSGQLTRAAGGSDPDVWTGTITAVADLTQASVWGESAVAQYSATDSLHNHVGFELTAVDTVTATRGRSDYAMTYTFEVVEWPTAATASSVSATAAATVGASENEGVGQGQSAAVSVGAGAQYSGSQGASETGGALVGAIANEGVGQSETAGVTLGLDIGTAVTVDGSPEGVVVGADAQYSGSQMASATAGAVVGADAQPSRVSDGETAAAAVGASPSEALGESDTAGAIVGASTGESVGLTEAEGVGVGASAQYPGVTPASASGHATLGASTRTSEGVGTSAAFTLGDALGVAQALGLFDGMAFGDLVGAALGLAVSGGASVGGSAVYIQFDLYHPFGGVFLNPENGAVFLNPENGAVFLNPKNDARWL